MEGFMVGKVWFSTEGTNLPSMKRWVYFMGKDLDIGYLIGKIFFFGLIEGFLRVFGILKNNFELRKINKFGK